MKNTAYSAYLGVAKSNSEKITAEITKITDETAPDDLNSTLGRIMILKHIVDMNRKRADSHCDGILGEHKVEYSMMEEIFTTMVKDAANDLSSSDGKLFFSAKSAAMDILSKTDNSDLIAMWQAEIASAKATYKASVAEGKARKLQQRVRDLTIDFKPN